MPYATPTAPILPAAAAIGLVEDEPVLLEELCFQLQHRGLPVVGFADANGLYRHLATQRLAVVVLDVGLPGEEASASPSYCAHTTRSCALCSSPRAACAKTS